MLILDRSWPYQPQDNWRPANLPGLMGVWIGSHPSAPIGGGMALESGTTQGVSSRGKRVTFGTYAGSGQITLPNDFRFVGASGTIVVGVYCGLWTSGEFPHIWSVRDSSTQIAAFVIDNNIANRYLTLTVGASTLNGPSAGRPYDRYATLAASFGNSGMRLYQDGVLVASNGTTTKPASTSIAPCIGNRSTGGRGFADSSLLYWAAFFDHHIGDDMHARIAADPYNVLVAPRRIWVPQTSGGTNTYTFSVSGGATFSGTSPLIRERIQTPSGGFSLSGAPVISHERAIQASGQVTFAGTAPIVNTASYQLTPSGGVTFSGSPDVIKEKVMTPGGGVSFGGSSRLIFVPVGGTGNNDSDRISVGVSRKIGVS